MTKLEELRANYKEAYDFCRSLYNKSGGVTPELQRAYEIWQKSTDEELKKQETD